MIGESLRVLVYEYLSGGGLAGQEISAGLLSEGYAMLGGVVADFRSSGHHVTVLRDERLAGYGLSLQASRVLRISGAGNACKVMQQANEYAEAALVIAPEEDQILQSLVQTVENQAMCSLNCSSKSIEQTTNKKQLTEHLKELNLPYPKTQTFSSLETTQTIAKQVHDIELPLVVKPACGSGCGGVSLVQNINQLEPAIEKIKTHSKEDVLVQEFIEGVSASVSLICTEKQALPLSLNKQDLTIATPPEQSTYHGGCVPLNHPLKTKAFETAKQLAESFSGLRGYVGIDLLLTEKDVYIMELNPRITTSYLGLRRTAQFNLAQAQVNASLNQEFPSNSQCLGYSCFTKIKIPNAGRLVPQQISLIKGVAAPPFPSIENKNCYALVEGHGKTLESAETSIEQTKKQLAITCTGDQ